MNLFSEVLRCGPIARGSTVLPATHTNQICLYSVSIHQTAPPKPDRRHLIVSYYSLIDPERMKG